MTSTCASRLKSSAYNCKVEPGPLEEWVYLHGFARSRARSSCMLAASRVGRPRTMTRRLPILHTRENCFTTSRFAFLLIDGSEANSLNVNIRVCPSGFALATRSEECRVGKGGVSPCRSRGLQCHLNNKSQ